VGCGPDLVIAGETGASFPFGDTGALAALLADWSANPGKVRAMGERARQVVLSGYTADHAVQGTLRAVQAIGQIGQAR
jgi:glycosyltransferase involved in cell wall biosynthesis